MQKESRIFVVDLDGTFIKNDLFIELLIMNYDPETGKRV